MQSLLIIDIISLIIYTAAAVPPIGIASVIKIMITYALFDSAYLDISALQRFPERNIVIQCSHRSCIG